VTIVDTIVRDNYVGIWFENGAQGDVARTIVVGNSYAGIWARPGNDSTVTVTVTDSVSSNNFLGFYATRMMQGGHVARMTVSRSTASNNSAVGFSVSGVGGLLTVSGSVASYNGVGFVSADGATFLSLGDNTVFDNTIADTDGTITVVAPK